MLCTRCLSLITIGLMLNLSLFGATSGATTKEEKRRALAEKVKLNIAKLGAGRDARVEVKLKDGTKLKGFISEIKEDYFVVTCADTGQSTTVAYSQTKQVKGNNLSTGVKIAIGVGIVLIILAVGFAARGV